MLTIADKTAQTNANVDKTMSPNADERLDAQDQSEELQEADSSNDYESDSNDEETAQEEQDTQEVSVDDSSEVGDGDGELGEDEEQEVRSRLNRAHSQIERLKAENARLKSKKGSQKGGEAAQEGSLVETEQALLAAYGHKSRDDQELIKEFARKGGMSVAEALNDDFVMSRFEHTKEKQRVARASARPSGKSKTAKRSPSYYIERGTMPKDPAAAREVRKELARRSSDGYITP